MARPSRFQYAVAISQVGGGTSGIGEPNAFYRAPWQEFGIGAECTDESPFPESDIHRKNPINVKKRGLTLFNRPHLSPFSLMSYIVIVLVLISVSIWSITINKAYFLYRKKHALGKRSVYYAWILIGGFKWPTQSLEIIWYEWILGTKDIETQQKPHTGQSIGGFWWGSMSDFIGVC